MSHTILCGQSRYGKTYLNQYLARESRKLGRRRYVLTTKAKVTEEGWEGVNLLTHDREYFMHAVYSSNNCDLFIEECLETVGRGNDAKVHVSKLDRTINMKALASEVAGLGHRCFFNMHDHGMVEPSIRNNCDSLYLFNVCRQEAEFWARNMNCDRLIEAVKLPKYYFLYCMRGQLNQDGELIVDKGKL